MNVDQIIYNHHIYKNKIDEASKLVENYIISNNLILVGGTAIDMALRTKGLKIYDDFDIPDYDVISDNNVQHAQIIGKLLCEHGFSNVSVNPAIHVTTVRVKFASISVFDSTYVPTNIIQKIPTMKYKQFTIIHPHFQLIDQYSSLSFLFEKTGETENIFHRLEKDSTRNKLLIDNFPFNFEKKEIKMKNISIDLDILFNNNKENILSIYDKDQLIHTENNIKFHNNDKFVLKENQYFEIDNNICIHGILAYNLYTNTDITIKDNKLFTSIPDNMNISLINSNNNIDNIIKTIKCKKITTFNKLLDLKPRRKLLELDNNYNIELLDLFGHLLSVSMVKINNYNFIIPSYTYLLRFFLTEYFMTLDNQYLMYFHSLLELDNKITINTFGTANYNDSYYYYLENYKYFIKNNKNSNLKPGKSYPTLETNCKTDKPFDFNDSIFFQIDGEISDKDYTNYSFILEQKNNLD